MRRQWLMTVCCQKMAKRYGILNRRQALIPEASIQNTNSSKPKDTRSRSYKQMPEPRLYKLKPRSKTTMF